MEKAIQKAIEGGYLPEMPLEMKVQYPPVSAKDLAALQMNLVGGAILLKPKFWQCLGKAMRWKDQLCMRCGGVCDGKQDPMSGEWDASCEGCGANWLDNAEFPEEGFAIKGYMYHWHRFIDHLAEGKSPDSFFEDLIK